MNVNVDQAWKDQLTFQICSHVGFGHVYFFAYLEYLAFIDGDAAVDDVVFEVGFGVD